ncbi:MAG TPA: hypothetical protein VLM83_09025 [Anaerolineales bacterium]|nr:hypothetical protein [Anaerolineales bacterium]
MNRLENGTANDFGVKELNLKEAITTCGLDLAHPGEACVVFERRSRMRAL